MSGSSSTRRIYPRQHRRLGVRFWREGDDRPRQGFTKNVSLTGAFVSTPDPAGRGERLRLELSDGGRGVMLYAVVVHAHRVPPELRRFADSAMGLRFLGLDEVVGPFLGEEALRPLPEGGPAEPAAAEGGGARPGPAGTSGSWPAAPRAVSSAPADGPGASPPPAAPPPAPPTERPPARAAGTGASPLAGTGARPLAGAPAATYVLAFDDAAAFLSTYRRDILNGGLFVTTDRPARLHERVAVDLRLPGAGAPTLRVEGRVVQVVDPRPLSSGRTTGGLGLELVDPDTVIARLAPHLAAYER
jgi:Tfp pilus assembly protein PilZ